MIEMVTMAGNIQHDGHAVSSFANASKESNCAQVVLTTQIDERDDNVVHGLEGLLQVLQARVDVPQVRHAVRSVFTRLAPLIQERVVTLVVGVSDKQCNFQVN